MGNCSFCGHDVGEKDVTNNNYVQCTSCYTPYHLQCYQENRKTKTDTPKCMIMGCTSKAVFLAPKKITDIVVRQDSSPIEKGVLEKIVGYYDVFVNNSLFSVFQNKSHPTPLEYAITQVTGGTNPAISAIVTKYIDKRAEVTDAEKQYFQYSCLGSYLLSAVWGALGTALAVNVFLDLMPMGWIMFGGLGTVGGLFINLCAHYATKHELKEKKKELSLAYDNHEQLLLDAMKKQP